MNRPTKWQSPWVGALSALALLGAPAAAQRPAYDVQWPADDRPYPTGSIFIENLDTVWTAAGEVLAGVSILVEDGIIRAIGPGLSAPNGVTVLDGRGLTAIPGLVDEHSHTALSGTNEFTAPIVPEVRVLDGLTTEDFGVYRALSGGVTTARIMHGSSNPIGGQSAVIKMRWGVDDTRQLLIPGAPKFVKFALGENVTRKGNPGSNPRFPLSRQGVEAIYREAFTAALAYRDAWREYEAAGRDARLPPRRDLRLEALLDILEGRIRIHAHSYRSDEILMLMRVAEEFGFHIDVFTHVLEGFKVASEMAEHGAAGSTFSDWWHYKLEAYDAVPYNAALMLEAGVLTGINTDIPWLQAFFREEIAKPVRYGGVSKEDALRMLTLNPAKMMYLDDRIGSLEVGKEADIVLLNGDPFDSYARVEKTLVDGIVYYDLSDEAGTRGESFHPLPEVAEAGAAAAPTEAEGAGAPAAGPDAAAPDDRVHPRNARRQEAPFALVGGTVHTVSGPVLEDGVVVVADGRIAAVGPAGSVDIPADAVRVDVSGKHVYPGMIDPVTPLGILEFGSVGQASDANETGQFNPHVRAVAAVQPNGVPMKVARQSGITAAGVAQSGGLIQGTAGVIQLSDDDTWERVTVKADAALVVNFPAPSQAPGSADQWEVFSHERDVHGGAGAWQAAGAGGHGLPAEAHAPHRAVPQEQAEEDAPEPQLTGSRMESLVEAFERARTYVAHPSVSDDPTAPWEPNVWAGDRVFLEAMAPALRGEMPVLFSAESEWQIRTLFVFLDRFPEVRGVVVGGTQAYKVADELAERDIPVILTGAYSPTPDRDESITASYRNAAILHAAGVRFAFATQSAERSRTLPQHAAHSVAFGLPPEAGLKAVTLAPAEILGLGGVMGSLDPGKRADIVVADGDLLQILTQVERMWIAGVEVDPYDNKQVELYRRFRGRR